MRKKVRHVGEVVAVVVAATDAIARDAADLVVVAYETLPVVTDALKALEHDAPLFGMIALATCRWMRNLVIQRRRMRHCQMQRTS